jgi:hypothetical protein
MDNAGIRHTSRALQVSINTVVRALKNAHRGVLPLLPLNSIEIELICEMDEPWSFVGRKKNSADCGLLGSLV